MEITVCSVCGSANPQAHLTSCTTKHADPMLQVRPPLPPLPTHGLNGKEAHVYHVPMNAKVFTTKA